MNPLRTLGLWLNRWVDRLVCAAGALLLAQAPSFLIQYFQRLGGHLDEARRQLTLLTTAAEKSGQPWREWATSAASNADPAVADLGRVVVKTADRVDSLTQAQVALRDASVWERPFAFARHFDAEVFRGTWGDYQPTLPTTAEGAVYALLGLTLAWVLYAGFAVPCTVRVARRLRGRGKTPAPTVYRT